MPDAYIQLPVDSVGKKVDVESLVVGAETVHRERDQIAGKAATEIAEVKNTDPAATLHGIVTRPLNVVGPVRDVLTSAALAAGASVNLDGTTVAAGKTGKLMYVLVSSSVACKWVVKSRDGAVELNFAVMFTGGLVNKPSDEWAPIDKRFTTLLGNGVDENFRVTVTNLDAENAGDVYATLLWDEV